MKNTKRLIAVFLVLALIMSFAACDLVTVDEEKDGARIVATVNGVDITKGEVMDMIEQYKTSYGLPEDYYDSEDTKDQYEELKNAVLDDLILRALLMDKATDLDLDEFTDEEQASLETEVASFIESNKSAIEMQVSQENEAAGATMTDEELAEEVQRQFNDYLTSYSTSEEELLDYFKDEQILYNVQEYILGDIAVTEAEIQEYYDVTLENQESTLSENPEMMDLISQVNSIILYDPLPTYYVRQILIATDEADEEIVTEATNQYYVAETDEEKEAALAIMEPAFQRIYPQVEEVVAKIDAGEDFDAIIESDGDDPGMASYPEGYPVKEGEGLYVDSFEKAAVALKEPGEISEPVKSMFGYHILKLISISPAGAIPFDDVKADIESFLLYNEQVEVWDTTTAEWKETADITEYRDRLN